jgi:phosphate acetyltransferase
VIEEDPALCAPTVAEVIASTGARVLLGGEPGLAREVRGFVFGGAMLPRFLDALFEGCLVITPGIGPTCWSAPWRRTPPAPRRSPGCF